MFLPPLNLKSVSYLNYFIIISLKSMISKILKSSIFLLKEFKLSIESATHNKPNYINAHIAVLFKQPLRCQIPPKQFLLFFPFLQNTGIFYDLGFIKTYSAHSILYLRSNFFSRTSSWNRKDFKYIFG